jgi:hypothetical protein
VMLPRLSYAQLVTARINALHDKSKLRTRHEMHANTFIRYSLRWVAFCGRARKDCGRGDVRRWDGRLWRLRNEPPLTATSSHADFAPSGTYMQLSDNLGPIHTFRFLGGVGGKRNDFHLCGA